MFGRKKKIENIPIWVTGYDYLYDEENEEIRIFDTTMINSKSIISLTVRKNKNKYYTIATLVDKETYIIDTSYTEERAYESIQEFLYKINLCPTALLDAHISTKKD